MPADQASPATERPHTSPTAGEHTFACVLPPSLSHTCFRWLLFSLEQASVLRTGCCRDKASADSRSDALLLCVGNCRAIGECCCTCGCDQRHPKASGLSRSVRHNNGALPELRRRSTALGRKVFIRPALRSHSRACHSVSMARSGDSAVQELTEVLGAGNMPAGASCGSICRHC